MICDNLYLKYLYHLYHHPKVEVFWLFLYILELFCWFLFRFRWDDCRWLKRLICDNQLHLKDLYLFVEMIVDDWRDWRLICDNRLYLKDLYHFFFLFFYIYQKVLKGYPVSRVKSSCKCQSFGFKTQIMSCLVFWP